MGIFYSASRRGFLDSELHELPDDAVRVTPARHAQMIEAQSAGAEIVPGAGGRPRIKRPELPPTEALRARAIRLVKREAMRRIEAVAPLWRQLNDLHEPDAPGVTERRVAINAIRMTSNRIEAELQALDAAVLADFDPALDTHWS